MTPVASISHSDLRHLSTNLPIITLTSVPSSINEHSTIYSTSSNTLPDGEAAKAESWCGRCISTTGKGVSVAVYGAIRAVQQVFTVASLLIADAPATAGVFRKLDQHVLRFLEHLGVAKGQLSKFSVCLRRNVAFIDFFQLAADINYFAAGRFKEKRNEKGEIEKARDHALVITGKLALFSADIGGTLLWLQEMSFFSLNATAAALGEVRLFSFIPKAVAAIPGLRDFASLQRVANGVGEFRAFSFVKNFSCLSLTLRAVDLAYLIFAVDAGRRLFNADNAIQAISAGLDLSSYLAELTLSAIVFAGVTNVVGLGIAGTTCIALALASFLYRVGHEKEITQKSQLSAEAVVV